jgi:hypothetical protein
MTSTASGKPQITRIIDSFGEIGFASGDSGARGRLVVGATLRLQVEAANGTRFGLAVGGEHLAAAEWNVAGSFEVIVTSHYAPRMVIHIAVREPKSEGSDVSEWLGPVDDYRVLSYDVEAGANDGADLTCPPA